MGNSSVEPVAAKANSESCAALVTGNDVYERLVQMLADKRVVLRPRKEGTGSGAHPVYQVPTTLVHCDRLISVAPLNLSASTGVWLTMGNCSGCYGRGFETGEPAQVLVDLLSFRPPDYALLGGEQGLGGDEPNGEAAEPVHHNVIVAGTNSVAVDAIGAAAMGRAPSAVKHLVLAEKKGLGTIDLDLIWTRGNAIEEAKGSSPDQYGPRMRQELRIEQEPAQTPFMPCNFVRVLPIALVVGASLPASGADPTFLKRSIADVWPKPFLMGFAPGGTNIPHHHEMEEEIYFVLKGSGQMVAGGGLDGNEGRHPRKEGDAWFLRLNTTVGFHSAAQPGGDHDQVLAVRSSFPVPRTGAMKP